MTIIAFGLLLFSIICLVLLLTVYLKDRWTYADWLRICALLSETKSERDELSKLVTDLKERIEDYRSTISDQVEDLDRLRIRFSEFAMERSTWQQERTQLQSSVEALKEFARDVRDNYDCDADAHRYGTRCRSCEAAEIIAPKETLKEVP